MLFLLRGRQFATSSRIIFYLLGRTPKYVRTTYDFQTKYVFCTYIIFHPYKGRTFAYKGVVLRTKTRTKHVYSLLFGGWSKTFFSLGFLKSFSRPPSLSSLPLKSQGFCLVGSVGRVVVWRGKMVKTQKLPSRQHSCSELASASKRVMAVKTEREEEDLLQQKIQENNCWILFLSAELF